MHERHVNAGMGDAGQSQHRGLHDLHHQKHCCNQQPLHEERCSNQPHAPSAKKLAGKNDQRRPQPGRPHEQDVGNQEYRCQEKRRHEFGAPDKPGKGHDKNKFLARYPVIGPNVQRQELDEPHGARQQEESRPKQPSAANEISHRHSLPPPARPRPPAAAGQPELPAHPVSRPVGCEAPEGISSGRSRQQAAA